VKGPLSDWHFNSFSSFSDWITNSGILWQLHCYQKVTTDFFLVHFTPIIWSVAQCSAVSDSCTPSPWGNVSPCIVACGHQWGSSGWRHLQPQIEEWWNLDYKTKTRNKWYESVIQELNCFKTMTTALSGTYANSKDISELLQMSNVTVSATWNGSTFVMRV